MRELEMLDNAWLLLEDGRIADFGVMQSVNALPRTSNSLDAKEGWIFPAFCDPHTHMVFATSREGEFVDKIKGLTYEQIAARGGGILNSAQKLQQMDESELFEVSLQRYESAISLGLGAIEMKSGYGLTLEDELKILRVIRKLKEDGRAQVKATCLALHAVPSEYKNRKSDFVAHMVHQLLPRVVNEGLADFVDVFCERNYFDIKDMLTLMEAGNKYGLPAKVHVNQFNSFGAVGAAVEAGAMSVDHLEVMERADFEALLSGNTMPTVLPGCSFYLRIPYAPARRLIDVGLPLAIASDFNPGSSPSFNPEFNMSLACIQQRLMPEEALNAATINAAAAMGLGNELGSITKGKRANIFITRPLPSLAYLPYSFGEKLVKKVILNGKEV